MASRRLAAVDTIARGAEPVHVLRRTVHIEECRSVSGNFARVGRVLLVDGDLGAN